MKNLSALSVLCCLSTALFGAGVFEKGRLWITASDGTKVLGLGNLDVRSPKTDTARLVSVTAADENTQVLEYGFGTNANLKVSGRISESNGVYSCSYFLETPEAFQLSNARLNLQVPHGFKKGNVEKYGTWNRCAANPLGEAYETFNLKLKRVSGKKASLCFELIGDENWSGPHTEYITFKKTEDGKYESHFKLYLSVFGFEAAAKHAGQPFAVYLDTKRRNNLWEEGPMQLRCVVGNVSGVEQKDVPVTVVVRNYDNKVVVDFKKTLTLKPGAREAFKIPIPETKRNLFFAEASVQAKDGKEIFTRTNAAILPPHEFTHRETSIFGVNARMGRVFRNEKEEEMALLKRMGMRHLRGGWNNALSRKYGIETLFHTQCPGTIYNPTNAAHVAKLRKFVEDVICQDCAVYEFGNEIAFGSDTATRHRLYDAYLSWLKALIAEREARQAKFKIIYGCSSYRPDLFNLIQEKGIWDLLDGFAVHPGRGYFTADLGGGGWRYLGMVQGSRKLLLEAGQGAKPLYLTEVYAKTMPNNNWHDSYRQAGENAVLNAAFALAENVAGFHVYQLHEGISFDENGVNPKNMEYHFGILHRDNSPKPSFMGYVTAAEELDGAKFVRYVKPEDKKDRLNGILFDTPRGKMALLYDRSEGHLQVSHAPFPRRKGEPFFHYEPWLDHWRVRKDHVFKATGKNVTVVDAIGRRTEIPAKDGHVRLNLSGAPVFVYGIDLAMTE